MLSISQAASPALLLREGTFDACMVLSPRDALTLSSLEMLAEGFPAAYRVEYVGITGHAPAKAQCVMIILSLFRSTYSGPIKNPITIFFRLT